VNNGAGSLTVNDSGYTVAAEITATAELKHKWTAPLLLHLLKRRLLLMPLSLLPVEHGEFS
jgi:hypothetical protein